MMATVRVSQRFAAIQRFTKTEPKKIYLCNWYVKLVRPGKEIPDNQVQCHVPLRMTKLDIKNYFDKIYNVKLSKVNTRIQQGKQKRIGPNKFEKTPDYKVAYLTLIDGETFKFPDLFSKYKNRRDIL